MPSHWQVDDTHKEFPFITEQRAKWEIPEEEKAILQIGLTAKAIGSPKELERENACVGEAPKIEG